MVILIGHGYVGQSIAKELVAQDVEHVCLHHDDEIPDEGVIINAAGYTGEHSVDDCEVKRAKTLEANVLFPSKLSRNGRCVIHILTGCIFDGDNDGRGWSEEDEPNFAGSFYAVSKIAAEKVIRPHLGNSYILRIKTPFGSVSHPGNLLDKLNSHERLVDVTNSLSCIEDVAKVAIWFAQNRPALGIYNVVNPSAISIKEIAAMMGLGKPWHDDQYKYPRSNCVLNSDKLQAIFPLEDVHTALEKCIKNYKENRNG